MEKQIEITALILVDNTVLLNTRHFQKSYTIIFLKLCVIKLLL